MGNWLRSVMTIEGPDIIRHECSYRETLAKAASQAESKIMTSSPDKVSPM
jgi:hypothetical protein